MQTDDINGIGTRIKEQRRKLSLTLSDMSAYTGLSNGHLSNIERNQTSPTLANLKRICEALGHVRLGHDKSSARGADGGPEE